MSEESKFITYLAALLKRGYVIIPGKDMGLSETARADLARLGRSAVVAPLDPNCTTQTRRRRFERALMISGCPRAQYFPRGADQDLESIQTYQQSAGYNPVESGRARPFAAFTEPQRDLPGLNELLQFDEAIARIVLGEPDAILEAHLHALCYQPREGVPSVSSPPFVHCDSEPITFAHILERGDVRGGFNAVTTAKWRNQPFEAVDKQDVLSAFTLTDLLDTFVVVDDVVAHYVSPIEADGPNPRRVVLLVDFTVLKAVKNEE